MIYTYRKPPVNKSFVQFLKMQPCKSSYPIKTRSDQMMNLFNHQGHIPSPWSNQDLRGISLSPPKNHRDQFPINSAEINPL